MPARAGADTGARPGPRTASAMCEAAGGGGDHGAAMRMAVKRLSFGASWEERAEAAAEVGRLARSDERTKRALPELGVVPPLLSMLADAGAGTGPRMAAARALLELARGTHRNKVHIVKAGLLKKLPELKDDRDLATSHDLALLLLSVSSLANTDFPLSSADLLPFLVATLSAGADDVPADTRLSCLAALRNLSANLEHVRAVAASGVVRALLALSLSLDDGTSEAALGVLSDLAAASAAARREMGEDEAAPRVLVEAVARHGGALCQEHATYLVMALAHGGGGAGRELMRRMRRLGAVQALLKVSLLGSPLAQSRAAKMLQWFKDDGQDRIRGHSGPRTEASSCHGKDGGADGTKTCGNAVDRIVKQSLDRNMKSIMRRATASVDMTTNATKMLVESSSSKSLPC